MICAEPGSAEPARVVFAPTGAIDSCAEAESTSLFCARAEWGGAQNPLLTALPERIEVATGDDPAMMSLAILLIAESQEPRCGSNTVLNRLGEVLLVRILRAQLAAGTTTVGVLGGLADPRLSHAIVAMHEHPGRRWSNDQLAEVAGLSLSRFADKFTATVGQTPMSYLRHWRMVLARQDIESGDRVQSVASRYGYASSEAMTRAFRREFGNCPTALRKTTSV